jgi:hypothetical protein
MQRNKKTGPAFLAGPVGSFFSLHEARQIMPCPIAMLPAD